jgi:AraC-like DNA-binding protein
MSQSGIHPPYAAGTGIPAVPARHRAPALREARSAPSHLENGAPALRPAGARESTLSMRFVRALVESMEHLGVSRAQLLRAARIEATELESAEARLPRAQAHRIFELAFDLSGDPALGLHLAEALTEAASAVIAHALEAGLVAHSASLREGFASLSQFQRLLGDAPYFELREQDDEATLRCLPLPGQSPRLQRFSCEMVLTSFFRLIRYFSADARPERVCFAYEAPSYRREYARVFERTERFAQPFTGMVIDRALLDLPSPNRDEGVHEALRALAERRTMRLARDVPYALRVREFLVQQGCPREIDMEAVARSFGLSVRSLRRRLASEGRTYAAIETDALAIVAKQLLRDKRRTIQETAYEMGFSDTTAFHRAFKRWTGTTPSAVRSA